MFALPLHHKKIPKAKKSKDKPGCGHHPGITLQPKSSAEFDLPAHKRGGSRRLCMHHTSSARTGLPFLMQTFIPLVNLQP